MEHPWKLIMCQDANSDSGSGQFQNDAAESLQRSKGFPVSRGANRGGRNLYTPGFGA